MFLGNWEKRLGSGENNFNLKATMDDQIQNIISLIEQSALDQTIKDILIRDLKAEGLTDFLSDQIEAYCAEGIKKVEATIEARKKGSEEQKQQNPAE